MDCCGRLWTPVESGALRFGLCGRLWTLVDTAWRSTDQKVGGSSPSGRAAVALHGNVYRKTELPRPSDVWEPFAGAALIVLDAELVAS